MVDFKRELEIVICGRPLKLKGSFECLSAIQSASGLSVEQITNLAAGGKLPTEVFPAIIFGGLVGDGNRHGFTFEQVKDLCFEEGFVSIMPIATKFFLLCINKNPNFRGDAPKNEVPATAGEAG